MELYLESNLFKPRSDMNTINTTTVVQHGRITVNVAAEDGTGVNVIIIPHRKIKEVEAILQEADRLRAEMPIRAPDPETLKRWVEEGRKS